MPSYSIDRINKQIRWGIKVCFFRIKYDSAHKILLKNKILPAEIQIEKTSLKRIFDIVQQKNIQDQKKSIIRNFVRKWNKLPRALRKEKSKKKFKKELKEEMQKRHERVPTDKKIEGFKNLFLYNNSRELETEP